MKTKKLLILFSSIIGISLVGFLFFYYSGISLDFFKGDLTKEKGPTLEENLGKDSIPKIKGYIVEFDEPSIIEKQQMLLRTEYKYRKIAPMGDLKINNVEKEEVEKEEVEKEEVEKEEVEKEEVEKEEVEKEAKSRKTKLAFSASLLALNEEEDIPAIEEDIPAIEEDIPAIEEDIPAIEEDIPATEEDIPATEEDIPATEEDIPATEEDIPATEEDIPATEEDIPATEEDIPATEEDISATEEDIPATEDDISATEEDVLVKSNLVLNEFKTEIRAHKTELLAKKELLKDDILMTINKSRSMNKMSALSQSSFDNLVLNEYTNAFNGLALDISKEESEMLKDLPGVKNVYPNYEVHATMMNTVPQVNADKVWALDEYGNPTGEGITIAVIDTGIDYTHPDFGSCESFPCDKVIGGYDFANDDDDPIDDIGHGTHVASISAGNGVLTGIAPDAKLYAYKVLDQYGSGTMEGVIAGIDRAVDPNNDGDTSDHVDIINMSLGGYGNPDDAISQAADRAVAAGVVTVIAAGNAGPSEQTIGSPGTARTVITVGAVDKNDEIAEFSSRGPVVWDGGMINKPDVVAPGVDVCAAQYDGWLDERHCNDDEDHIAISGTSMATPVVAGAVALLKQAHPEWSPQNIKDVLMGSAKNLQLDINTQGKGRIDILAAISFVPPEVEASLNTSGLIDNITNIAGSAFGDGFKEYFLYIKNNFDDTAEWVELIHATNPVVDGVLLSDFNSINRKDGAYMLRLDVIDTNDLMAQAYSQIEIDNIQILNPVFDEIYRVGDVIEIKGVANGDGELVVEYSVGGHPDETWLNEGITIVNNDDLIATWDTSVLSKSETYSIRVGVGENYEYVYGIHLDATLKEGWPVRLSRGGDDAKLDARFKEMIDEDQKSMLEFRSKIKDESVLSSFGLDKEIKSTSDSDYDYMYYNRGLMETQTVDLDKNGSQEVIVYYASDKPTLIALNSDGTFLWKKEIGTLQVPGKYLPMPVIADIDNDGFDDIICYTYEFVNMQGDMVGKVYAINHEGDIIDGWPVEVPDNRNPTLLVADLDQDGVIEIIIKGSGEGWLNERSMVILDSNGKIINQWNLPSNIKFSDSRGISLAVGNFDEDESLEIVAVLKVAKESEGGWWVTETEIHIFNQDGLEVEGWPLLTESDINNGVSPAVGDINNDGQQDIIVGYTGGEIGVFAYNRDGSLLTGWPVVANRHITSSITLVDYNDDKQLEVIASGGYKNDEDEVYLETYMIDSAGNIMENWPQETCGIDLYSSVAGDITGDGISDIVTTTESQYDGCGVYAWEKEGKPVLNFPKFTERSAKAPAVIADLDGDKKMEVIASSEGDWDSVNNVSKNRGSIYVWETEGKYTEKSLEWPTYMHDNAHTGCYDCVEPEIVNKSCIGNEACGVTEYCEFNGCVADTGLCQTLPLECDGVTQFVCGCDGKTYQNDCIRKLAKISKNHDNSCEINPAPTPEKQIFNNGGGGGGAMYVDFRKEKLEAKKDKEVEDSLKNISKLKNQKLDTDGDGISDYDEIVKGIDPLVSGDTPLFTDLAKEAPWTSEYDGFGKLVAIGAVSGYENKEFKPNQNITRAEFIKILFEMLSYYDQADLKEYSDSGFMDVYSGAWYSDYFGYAAELGILSEGRPAANITRAEVSKIIVLALDLEVGEVLEKPFIDTFFSDWSTPYIAELKDKGVIGGYADGRFIPNNNITRAEASKILMEVMSEFLTK